MVIMTSITNAIGILLPDVIRCHIATINPPMVGVLLTEVTITDITGVLMNMTDGLLGRYNSPPLNLHCISSSSNISIWLEGRLLRELITSLRVFYSLTVENWKILFIIVTPWKYQIKLITIAWELQTLCYMGASADCSLLLGIGF